MWKEKSQKANKEKMLNKQEERFMKKKLLTLLGISVVLGGIVAFGSMNMNAVPVRAEEGGDTTEVVEDTTEEPVVESNDDPSVIQEVKNYFETVILPAVIASASTLIITAAGLIVKTIMTKAKDKHITEQVDRSADLVFELKDKYVGIAMEMTAKLKDICNEVQIVIDENKLLKDHLAKYENNIINLPVIENKIDELIQIEVKLASVNKELVSSGVAEELNKIVEEHKKN